MIYKITGESAHNLAQTLRNGQIGQGKGALLVINDHAPRHQLEKIIAGLALPDHPVPASEIPWKQDSVVLFVGDDLSLLDEFEALTPGFKELFGPVQSLTA